MIQNLRLQEATLQAQIDQDASQFGAAYPKLIQERASLKGVQQSLQDELKRIAERAENDFEVASKAEQGARAAYESDRSAAEKLNDKSIEYAILSKEADQSQELYQDLLKRLKEAGILEGLHSSNVTVVDLRTPPARPSKPHGSPCTWPWEQGWESSSAAAQLCLSTRSTTRSRAPKKSRRCRFLCSASRPRSKRMKTGSQAIMLDSRHSDGAFGESVRRLRSGLLISRSGILHRFSWCPAPVRERANRRLR